MLKYQKPTMENTVVSVKMRPIKQRGKQAWALALRAFPVIEDGKRKEKLEYLNRVITTPIWDTKHPKHGSKGVTYDVKRDKNGVIMCESALDQESCAYAQQMRNVRQREYDVAHIYEGHEEEAADMEKRKTEDFIEYFEHLCEQRGASKSSATNTAWILALNMFKKFMKGKPLRFDKINLQLINNYRSWVQTQPSKMYKSGKQIITSTTAAKHFMFLRAALRRAYNDGYLEVDIHAKTKAIPKQMRLRESFSMEEVQRLYDTPCENKVLKRAALFSVYTGLRLGDLQKLQWKHIRNVDGMWRLDFVQNKTQESNFLPVSDQALSQCGKRGKPEEYIFKTLGKTAWFKPALNQWLDDAGIERHMTFHCFRHTFATLQLENGTDIYTIKSMMGHTSVNTTQVYSHIVAPSLRAASDSLFIKGLTIEF